MEDFKTSKHSNKYPVMAQNGKAIINILPDELLLQIFRLVRLSCNFSVYATCLHWITYTTWTKCYRTFSKWEAPVPEYNMNNTETGRTRRIKDIPKEPTANAPGLFKMERNYNSLALPLHQYFSTRAHRVGRRLVITQREKYVWVYKASKDRHISSERKLGLQYGCFSDIWLQKFRIDPVDLEHSPPTNHRSPRFKCTNWQKCPLQQDRLWLGQSRRTLDLSDCPAYSHSKSTQYQTHFD